MSADSLGFVVTRILSSVLAISLLAGCQSLQGAGQKINAFMGDIGDAATGRTDGSVPEGYSSVKTSNIAGALNRGLPNDGNTVPEWPKVVITDLSVPAAQLDRYRQMEFERGDECILFNAVLWEDENSKENIDNLSFCPADFERNVSNNWVIVWSNFGATGKTTGRNRTDGPNPPSKPLPNDTQFETWDRNAFAKLYIGLLTREAGYDPDYSIDTRRFWVKNLAEPH